MGEFRSGIVSTESPGEVARIQKALRRFKGKSRKSKVSKGKAVLVVWTVTLSNGPFGLSTRLSENPNLTSEVIPSSEMKY